MTTSAFAAASVGVETTMPTPTDSARDRVRFQSVSSWPASVRRLAIAPPIFPVPRMATRMAPPSGFLLVLFGPLAVLDDVARLEQHVLQHRAPLRLPPRE